MRAVLCGYYGFGNGGDEALLVSLLQMLPAHVEPVVLSADPRGSAERYGVSCCDRWNLLAVSSTIARADAFIWGGGSLMQDVTGRGSVLYYGSLMQLAQVFGKRTIAWAQGIGPLDDPWARNYTRRLLASCTAVSVRDQGSARLLAGWGIKAEQTVDPVWALQPIPQSAQLPAPVIAVVLRPHPEFDARRQAVFLEALVRFQRATGCSVLAVPFQQPGDVALAEAVTAALPPGTARTVLEGDPRRLMGLFGEATLTIAMRLHGGLMAAACGSRIWGLSYDPKVSQLLSEIGAPGCTLGELPDEPDRLAGFWLDHYRQGSGLSDGQRRAWHERAQGNATLLARVL